MDWNAYVEEENSKGSLFRKDILQLKTNKIPRGLVELERLFDNKDMANFKPNTRSCEEVEKINLGSENNPREFYIGKKLTPKIITALVNLLRKYIHVFAWSYDDLKAYREDLFQHEIPLKPDEKPFRQKQRPINPTLSPKMKEELMKMRNVGIIEPIRHSTWVSNLVPVRKKNGDIRLCVDFINLNISSLKDNYALPNMEALLQKVTRNELLSMMDGFFGYNQVKVKESEKYKTTFTTPWGTYVYARMSFGLTNFGTTFQRAMDVAFEGLIDYILFVYQDDLIAYSKKAENHCNDLIKIFIRALEYGISLNP